MDMTLMKRYDSLSPEMKPCRLAPSRSAPDVYQGGQTNTRVNSQYTFIMAKVSDFEGKPVACGRGGTSRKVSAKKPQSASRDPKKLPSLAATHPALYSGALKVCKQEMQPSPASDHRSKKERLHRVKIETVDSDPPAPWRTYVDPKSLTSQDPAFDDPKIRMLRTDVLDCHARVISPVLMVGLPCGTIVEAAHVYHDIQGQPRDPPIS